MKSSLTKTLRAVPLACASLLLAGAAHAALQDRDLNGDTVVDAFYDTDLNITWLRDANVNGGTQYWSVAVGWARAYSIGGYSDWRLPNSDLCQGYNCTGSEMGHLWYVELGNPPHGPLTNTGKFENLASGIYWSGTLNPSLPGYAFDFYMNDGLQHGGADVRASYGLMAMFVRDGDVAAIPEPETYALMLSGLAGLALARRQRRG